MMQESIEEFARELRFFVKLRHTNIVPFLGLYSSEGALGAAEGARRLFIVTFIAVEYGGWRLNSL